MSVPAPDWPKRFVVLVRVEPVTPVGLVEGPASGATVMVTGPPSSLPADTPTAPAADTAESAAALDTLESELELRPDGAAPALSATVETAELTAPDAPAL